MRRGEQRPKGKPKDTPLEEAIIKQNEAPHAASEEQNKGPSEGHDIHPYGKRVNIHESAKTERTNRVRACAKHKKNHKNRKQIKS